MNYCIAQIATDCMGYFDPYSAETKILFERTCPKCVDIAAAMLKVRSAWMTCRHTWEIREQLTTPDVRHLHQYCTSCGMIRLIKRP